MLTRVVQLPIIQPIISWVVTRFESYWYGRANQTKIDLKPIAEKAEKNKDHVHAEAVGKGGFNLAVYAPERFADMEAVINELDSQPKGRDGYKVLNAVVGNGDKGFVLTRTGGIAQHQRHLLLEHLKPTEYPQLAVDATLAVLKTQPQPFTLNKDLFRLIIRSTLAKGLLGMDAFPAALTPILNKIEIGEFTEIGNFNPGLLSYHAWFGSLQNQYNQFFKTFLQHAVQLAETAFKNYPDIVNRNYLLTVVIDEIKKANPALAHDDKKLAEFLKKMPRGTLQKFLQNSVVKALPLVLTAADNLIKAVDGFFDIDPGSLRDLGLYLHKKKVFTGTAINFAKLKSIEYLDIDWLGSLTFQHPGSILRYAEKGIKIGNTQVPPKTMLHIRLCDELDSKGDLDAKIETSSRSLFFSAGKRKCPGRFLAEAIFKAILATVAYFYEYDSTKPRNFKSRDISADAQKYDEGLKV